MKYFVSGSNLRKSETVDNNKYGSAVGDVSLGQT